ncbi:MAG TPA: ATP-binding protein [Sphingomonas sp.]|jgi:two-component system phosphate regulon sensor histidine kinase PhoR|uniref:ATP-binding protein n=1 Tax=Sphingomonas sp. TaxID=28214 RepID=UPI002ED98B74
MRILLSLIAGVAAGTLAWLLHSPVAVTAFCATLAVVALFLAAAPAPPTPRLLEVDDDRDQPDLGIDIVLDAIRDPLLVIEGQRVRNANRAARALLGDHIVGEDVRLAIRHPAAADRLAGRQPGDGAPVELVGLGDHARRFALTVHPLRDGARLARLVDRTAIHAAERSRVDFVANASHELRTPLATLLGFIETLEDRNAAEDGPTRARFLKIMFGEAKRMQRLVDDLMSLSRIEADKYSLPETAVPLDRLLADVRRALVAGLELDDARIIVVGDGAPCDVAGDPAQLSQLLHNVIGNALKYGRSGTPVTVDLRCASPAMVRLAVSDQGDGIPPEHLPRITERFYRVDPGRSRALGGTGLGLAIVKHIVERHRGRLSIDSVVGTGTTVTMLLPRAPETLSSNGHETVTGEEAKRPSAA